MSRLLGDSVGAVVRTPGGHGIGAELMSFRERDLKLKISTGSLLEHYFCRALGHWYIISEERSIRTMLLLLDSHWKLLQRLALKPALTQHTS
jgi:hypothetical protein